MREWMIEELAPRPGDTVLELAAGAGDTGFEAAAIVGAARPADLDRLLPGDGGGGPPPRRRARARERGLPGDGRRAHRARRRLGRRRALPVRLHADARPRRRARRDAPRAAPGRAPRARGVERARAQPVGRRSASGSWSSAATCRRPSPAPRARSRWRARSTRGRCSRAPASRRCVRRRSRFASPSATSTTTRTYTTDTGGPAALALRGLPEDELEILKTRLRAAFAPFAADGGYALPGLALAVAAS